VEVVGWVLCGPEFYDHLLVTERDDSRHDPVTEHLVEVVLYSTAPNGAKPSRNRDAAHIDRVADTGAKRLAELDLPSRHVFTPGGVGFTAGVPLVWEFPVLAERRFVDDRSRVVADDNAQVFPVGVAVLHRFHDAGKG